MKELGKLDAIAGQYKSHLVLNEAIKLAKVRSII